MNGRWVDLSMSLGGDMFLAKLICFFHSIFNSLLFFKNIFLVICTYKPVQGPGVQTNISL